MRVILSILLSMVVSLTFGQAFAYSYNDPCTGVLKTINVPTNGVTITYYGQINTFNQSDFQNGNFNNWSNNIYNTYGSNNPCGSIIGISTGIDIGVNPLPTGGNGGGGNGGYKSGPAVAPTAGTNGRGGGGGGRGNTTSSTGASGGSGVVIVRFASYT